MIFLNKSPGKNKVDRNAVGKIKMENCNIL